MGALEVRGLSQPGLGPVDLDLAAGECIAVQGQSGSGKSRLLRAIADLDPAEGSVRLDGTERTAMPAPAWRKAVGYLAAESGWWNDTVAAHFPDPKAAAALLPELGLPAEALGWSVTRLSTGEKQRLALARLLLVAPKVMLLDEPTSGLDTETIEAVEAALKQRLAAGAACILVTHAPDQARRMASRLFRVAGGRLSGAAP